MVNLVEFPGLGISLEVNRVAFTLFGMPVYWYGVLIGAGLFLAVAFAFSQAKSFGIDGDRMVDVLLLGFVCAILGLRIYYIAFYGEPINSVWDFFNFRGGGLAIYGGIIGAYLGGTVVCLLRKVPLLAMYDLGGMGFLIGQAIGRWGNFTNQEAFGSNTTLPWGMISPATTRYLEAMQPTLAAQGVTVDPYSPVHPTFLYESLWCALGFLLLFLYRKRRKFNGEICLFYVMWYGAGRFFIDCLRTDSLMTSSGLRASQVLAGLSFLAALTIWIIARVKTRGKPLVVPAIPPHTAKVAIVTEDGPKKLVVEWPADEKPPSKAQRLEMAQQQWEKQHPGKNAEKDAEDPPGEDEAADEEKGGDVNDGDDSNTDTADGAETKNSDDDKK